MVTKKESDGEHPASHYLVVEDPTKVATWHLRVKDADGKVDHGLLGAAYAALLSPGGYRGQSYEGPNKGDAIAKLKALYEAEGMDWPGDSKNAAGIPATLDAAQVGFSDDTVIRTGKLFEAGAYPDKAFELTMLCPDMLETRVAYTKAIALIYPLNPLATTVQSSRIQES